MKDIKFADIGEGIHEGILRQWSVQPGEAVKEGQTLFLVETDKVTAEIPSPFDGTVHEVMAAIGDTIHVGQTILRIDDGSGDAVEEAAEAAPSEVKSAVEAAVEPTVEPAASSSQEPAGQGHTEAVKDQGSTSVVGQLVVSSDVIPSSDENTPPAQAPAAAGAKVLATPVARQMAKDLGVDITTLKGTGPAGRIMKEDIRNAAESKGGKPAAPEKAAAPPAGATQPAAAGEQIPLTMMRKTIARNMVLSKTTIPHAAAMDEVDVTELVQLRKEMKDAAELEGVHLTFMGFILKAVAVSLREHPRMNASLSEDGESIRLHPSANVGIAVDTPEGLMVPVIHRAETKGILALAAETAQLAERCRSHTVKLEELQGGTFSITNYGATGTLYGLPVIKPPEAAILGVGTITKKPVVIDGEIVVRDILTLTLCFDHRIVDGGDAGRFMNDIKRLLKQPLLLLMK